MDLYCSFYVSLCYRTRTNQQGNKNIEQKTVQLWQNFLKTAI